MNTLPKLLSAYSVAESLGVSAKTIRRMVLRGEFPKPIKIGGQLRWHPNDVAPWIESRRKNRSRPTG